MSSQPLKKEELLRELDSALNRKIQQKYSHNHAKTQLIPQQSQMKSQLPKYDQKQESKMYRSKESFAKSPISSKPLQLKKDCCSEIKNKKNQAQKFSRGMSIKQIALSKPIQTEQSQRDTYYNHAQYSTIPNKPSSQMGILKQESKILEAQLEYMKNCIRELQNQSRKLKRQENEYSALKEQNVSLKREIEFLRTKLRNSEDSQAKEYSNLSEIMKKIMIQLNIHFINKQQNEQCTLQSLQEVSKAIYKLSEEKTKLSAKMNTFDVQTHLAKENNLNYKHEIQELRTKLSQYEEEARQNKQKIADMQVQFEEALDQNMRVEAKFRETYKQLETTKKNYKMLVESYKHRKPKRETHFKKDSEVPLEQSNTLITSSNDIEIQTDAQQEEKKEVEQIKSQLELQQIAINCQAECQQLKSQLQQCKLQLLKSQEYKSQLLLLKSELASRNADLKEIHQNTETKIGEYQKKSQQYESYIKELEEKCEEITQDIAHFMPQLKQIEEENQTLRASHAYKDQELIFKIQQIHHLRSQNEILTQQLFTYEQKQESQSQYLSVLKKQKQQMEKKIAQLNNRQRELVNQSRNSELLKEDMQNFRLCIEQQLKNEIKSYEQSLQSKDKQLKMIENKSKEQQKLWESRMKEWEISHNQSQLKQKQYQTIIQALEINSKEFLQKTQTFTLQKSKVKEVVQQIIILNTELTKKQTQYESLYNHLQNKLIALQNQHNLVSQSYYQLELNSQRAEQEMLRLRRENNVLQVSNQNLRTELALQKLNVQKMKAQLKENEQMNKKYNNEVRKLSLRATELQAAIQKQIIAKQNITQQATTLNQQRLVLEHQLSLLLHNQNAKNNQLHSLQERVTTLANQNRLLFEQFETFKSQAEEESKRKTEKLSNQNYDLERIVRENRQLRTKLDQLTYLSESKQLSYNELSSKVQTITEQNTSLTKKYQYLCEQLEVRQRSKEEDQYINQLKNKQYCLILRNILSNIVDVTDFQSCSHFEEILEIGSERVMNRKKDIRNEESLRKKQLKRDSYLHQYGMEVLEEYAEPKRFKFGTQINSFEELPHLKPFSDENHPNSENMDQFSLDNIQRSFIFNLSPGGVSKSGRSAVNHD